MITLLSKTIQITQQSSPENLVERAIVDVCEEMQIGDEKFGNILLAVTEAVDNAIEHGNQNNPNKKVELSYQSSPEEITFSITDEGQGGFGINTVTDPTKPENPEDSGRGLLIMKMLSDKLEFINEEKKVLL